MNRDKATFGVAGCQHRRWSRLLTSLFFLFLILVAVVTFNGSVMAAPTLRATPTAATPAATPTYGATPLPTISYTPGPYDASTGWHSPTGQEAVSSGDQDGYERNPVSAFEADGIFAADRRSGSGSGSQCDSPGKERHDFFNYGFPLPADAAIAGLEVQLEAKSDSTAGSPKLCVQLSWDGGVSWTAAKTTPTLNTSETTYLLGGPADHWFYNWSHSELDNANFRLRISNVSSDVNRGFWLDWVAVNIYYSASTPPLPTATPTPMPGAEGPLPLMDMDVSTYLGFSGGLYPNGSNQMPPEHALAGMARANLIQPLDTAGHPSPDGKYVMLAVGMSNTAREFGVPNRILPWTFIGVAADDPAVNQTDLILMTGARSGQDAPAWESPSAYNYDWIRDNQLFPNGLSENQVQVVWLKVANGDASSHPSLPSPDADAYVLMSRMGNILRALRSRYPNLQQVFISSRVYAGYATDEPLNPEPYAYESGFAVKWLIEAQIQQMASGGTVINEWAGDLNYNTVVPWIAWGPYMWANGSNPRSDGLIWLPEDFADDGTHPYISGQQKVADMLLDFFKNAPMTECWFLDECE